MDLRNGIGHVEERTHASGCVRSCGVRAAPSSDTARRR
jgi:hypothetical protein